MQLRKIEFGNVLGASGVQGFFGEGYWFHPAWKPFGLDFSDVTFVSKTATLRARAGNMVLASDFSPRYPFPLCVRARPFEGLMLNSVGLSNPGVIDLLNTFRWQSHAKPFWISVTTLADTPETRLDEIQRMVAALALCKHQFKSLFGLQINLSCPNTGHDPKTFISEWITILEAASHLGVPIMPKFSIASAPIAAVMELEHLPYCDAICVSNTIPYDWKPDGKFSFGLHTWRNPTSPLQHLGGGGISGAALKPLVCDWIKQLRATGFTKPINGGGGILCKEDVRDYHQAGASSIFIGSVATLRPWRVKGIVKYTNELVWR